MYEKFFGLSEKPFSIQPDPSFLYWGRTHRLAYAMLEYGVLNHAGISVITGEVGCGKTTLIHRLLDQLSDTHTVSLLSNVQEGRGDLLSWVLMGFGEPFAGKTHVEMFSQLQSFFISEYAKGRRVVLVIDEAQNLSADMLEELRLLSNINAGKDQLLQLILVGQPQLKGLLNKPELLQLAQRVGADFHLTPLNREEVHAYIETRLAIAGCKRRIFTDRAMDFIAEQSHGVPRVINIIADTALVYAFSAEELVVGVETIRNVVRDKTEFGVFGLASDDAAAAPLPAGNRTGLDSFADAGDKEELQPEPEERNAETSPKNEKPLAAPVREQKPAPVAAKKPAPQQERETTVKAPPVQKIKPLRREASSTTASSAREESSVTGVVVIAVDEKGSPEAAVRSVGDGRAIVFVPRTPNDDARLVARNAGAVIAECSDGQTATLGKMRNAGYRQLKKIAPHIEFVQFIDSDQAIAPDWIGVAENFMARRPEVAIVEGVVVRQQLQSKGGAASGDMRDPDAETELDVVDGGGAFVRARAFEDVGGFRGDIPAAAMPDLTIRLRRRNGRAWRLGSIMTIGATSSARGFGVWWRARSAQGYKNALSMSLHGGAPDRLGVNDTAAAVFLGAIAPLAILVLAAGMALLAQALDPLANPLAIAGYVLGMGVLLYLAAIIFAAFSRRQNRRLGLAGGAKSVAGRIPEFFGAMRHWTGRAKPR